MRMSSFRKKIPLNENLLGMVKNVDSHLFLENPAGQNCCLYLCEYLKNVSEYWFKKKICDLRVLDWGCGKGHLTFLLKEMRANVFSCDLETRENDSSFGQYTPIIEKGGIEVIPIKHQYLLPFGKETFDVVLGCGVLEHVSNDFESLKEINRILSPSGLFFCFYLPYFFSWTQNVSYFIGNFYHEKLYRKKTVKALLPKTGFDLIDIWHRQLFPKNTIKYPNYHLFEKVDQLLVNHTWLRYFATNIEFVASKK